MVKRRRFRKRVRRFRRKFRRGRRLKKTQYDGVIYRKFYGENTANLDINVGNASCNFMGYDVACPNNNFLHLALNSEFQTCRSHYHKMMFVGLKVWFRPTVFVGNENTIAPSAKLLAIKSAISNKE